MKRCTKKRSRLPGSNAERPHLEMAGAYSDDETKAVNGVFDAVWGWLVRGMAAAPMIPHSKIL